MHKAIRFDIQAYQFVFAKLVATIVGYLDLERNYRNDKYKYTRFSFKPCTNSRGTGT
ncbi:hypothetical protein NCCP28_41260 [Niallia sp. NCCP-28]|nr:hypothetical protein NCCP28_41260 [Niallia sp. NCCP-28]